MRIVRTIGELRAAVGRRSDINFVPTMGNLHEGHLSLVRMAAARDGMVVASIFVNPLQFAPHEDFETYPRTLKKDCALLQSGGCDLLFAPSPAEMYPEPQEWKVHPPHYLGGILEGQIRPGFFIGVSTVVLKLFCMVQPRVAIFGKKDYQQWLVVKDLVAQFALPIEIVAGETVRDKNGLALSSRNGYLTDDERLEAVSLSTCLRSVAAQVRAGRRDWAALEEEGVGLLKTRGWLPDYIAIRRRVDLGEPRDGELLVALGAARLGGTRLIDNLEI